MEIITIKANASNVVSRLLSQMNRYDEDYFWVGDMEEEYRVKSHSLGKGRATMWLWKQVLRSMPSYFKDPFYGV